MSMRKSIGVALFAIASGVTVSSDALILTSPINVVRIHAYTDYGGGDVVFSASATFSGCDGFWLSPADPGFKQAYAALLMVKAQNMTAVLLAYDTALWPGSTSTKYCRVRSITPQ